jgi:hypothetical protein
MPAQAPYRRMKMGDKFPKVSQQTLVEHLFTYAAA